MPKIFCRHCDWTGAREGLKIVLGEYICPKCKRSTCWLVEWEPLKDGIAAQRGYYPDEDLTAQELMIWAEKVTGIKQLCLYCKETFSVAEEHNCGAVKELNEIEKDKQRG